MATDGRERAVLLLFGVIEIFAGIFLGLSAVVLAVLAGGGAGALGMDSLTGPSPLPAGSLTTSALLYAGLAAVFVVLGVGSLLPRRWVRPLVLYLASVWLLAGALLFVVIAGLVVSASRSGALPGTDAESPAGMLGSPLVLLFLGAVSFVLYLVLPAALFWFHRRTALRIALERLDPVPRWTDRCPAPVLSLSLSLAISALLCLPFARGPVPLFGWTLTGAAAAGFTLLAAAALGALAIAVYRLSALGWWGSLAAVVFFTILSVDLSFRVDLASLLTDVPLAAADGGAASGGPGAADAVSGSAGWFLGAGSLLFGAVCLVAVLRVRRYFIQAQPTMPAR